MPAKRALAAPEPMASGKLKLLLRQSCRANGRRQHREVAGGQGLACRKWSPADPPHVESDFFVHAGSDPRSSRWGCGSSSFQAQFRRNLSRSPCHAAPNHAVAIIKTRPDVRSSRRSSTFAAVWRLWPAHGVPWMSPLTCAPRVPGPPTTAAGESASTVFDEGGRRPHAARDRHGCDRLSASVVK